MKLVYVACIAAAIVGSACSSSQEGTRRSSAPIETVAEDAAVVTDEKATCRAEVQYVHKS